MKKVININFQGSVIPIEETAYDILKQYVESLRNYFANEEGKEEIINDIEGRIAELFGETLKKGTTCIGDEDVNKIIDSMGRPVDFDADADFVQPNKTQEKTNYNANFNEHKKLYRDENQKVIGGVCSGIANYLNIDPLIARILFVVFFGFAFLLYLVLWIVIPSSATKVIGSQRKRFFRDTDDKIIGGVCSGISQYFGINVWIPRLLFLLPFLSFGFNFSHWNWWNLNHIWNITFSPGSLFVYIILWLVLPEAKTAAERALVYMGLEAGTPLKKIAIDTVFLGSCTNGRIEDLRAAASVLEGKKIATTLRMLVVPGSERVRQQAMQEGLDKVFIDAGAEWRNAGCSMCLGMNPDQLAVGERSASTSNRNFEGRQGKGGRTHLVSPLVAAATAIRGTLSSPADL